MLPRDSPSTRKRIRRRFAETALNRDSKERQTSETDPTNFAEPRERPPQLATTAVYWNPGVGQTSESAYQTKVEETPELADLAFSFEDEVPSQSDFGYLPAVGGNLDGVTELSPFAEADKYLNFGTPVQTMNEPIYCSQNSKTVSNSSASCTFSFEFPQSAAEVILNKEAQLKEYATQLEDGGYAFEFGYDLLPQGCWVVFEEQEFLLQSICLCLLR